VLHGLQQIGRQPAARDEMDQRAVEAEYHAGRRTREGRGVGGDRVEGRLHVGRRAGDDAQDLCRRRLLLQGFARLGDEPGIVHRDDRLRRKVLQQRDLIIGERADLLTVYGENAEHRVIFPQRHPNRSSCATEIDKRAALRVANPVSLAICNIGDVYAGLASGGPSKS